MTIKIGILGAGFIADVHMTCLKQVYGVPVSAVGVCDIVQEKSRAFADRYGIQSFRSPAELIDAVDAVDICTPPAAHFENILEAATAGRHIFCEKPLIGYAPPPDKAESFHGLRAPKQVMLETVRQRLALIRETVTRQSVRLVYFENFVYTPQVQKEAEIVRKSKAQILRMMGEETHFGNHAAYSRQWRYACGGSLISTGSHPLGAILYLKRVEGEASRGRPIRPVSVSARVHQLTGIPDYRDEGFIRCDYHDVEDYGWLHVVFEDGTVGDIIAGATVLGGIHDSVDVFANNHRTRCQINPAELMKTYNPRGGQLEDVAINYGISTKEGWLYPAPDENWMFGYQAEMQDALESLAHGREAASGLELAIDTIDVIYAAYMSAEQLGREIAVMPGT